MIRIDWDLIAYFFVLEKLQKTSSYIIPISRTQAFTGHFSSKTTFSAMGHWGIKVQSNAKKKWGLFIDRYKQNTMSRLGC